MDTQLVAQFLGVVALMAATIEYCELIQRRETARHEARLRDEAGDTGLQGLVRVFLADQGRLAGRYQPE